MAGYNLPDDLLPNSPEAPWNKEEIEIVDAYRFREFHIPLRMMPSIELYINQGIQPGDFLTAVICNDLASASLNILATDVVTRTTCSAGLKFQKVIS